MRPLGYPIFLHFYRFSKNAHLSISRKCAKDPPNVPEIHQNAFQSPSCKFPQNVELSFNLCRRCCISQHPKADLEGLIHSDHGDSLQPTLRNWTAHLEGRIGSALRENPASNGQTDELIDITDTMEMAPQRSARGQSGPSAGLTAGMRKAGRDILHDPLAEGVFQEPAMTCKSLHDDV